MDTTHWTGKSHRLCGLVRIDGKPWRVIGTQPAEVPALPQTSLTVLPTRTIYQFSGGGVALTLSFTTPALPESVDLLSRPVTYVTWSFNSTDGKTHDVMCYFDASSELTVNEPAQSVVWSGESIGNLGVLKIGSQAQRVLGRKGDDLRIDWGYLYTAAEAGSDLTQVVASATTARNTFATGGTLPSADTRQPRPAGDETPVAALAIQVGKVGSTPVSRWLMVAYDDLYSIQFMKRNLRPYWRRNGWEAAGLVKATAAEYPDLAKRCAAFDTEFMADMTRAGGEKYAKICALAYRQCFAAGKFVADTNGQPLSFCKENHSNGCIGTSDVFYPMAPQFLLFGPTLAKSFLVPFMDYAGHMAHNVNLSVKAICGIAAFAKLCDMRGDKAKSAEYFKLARDFAAKWMNEADDGRHYRLAFDKPGSWSQKYNLVWDRILRLNLFPDSVANKEMAYYRKFQNIYGLPLDNRQTYTKLDWILWTATLTQDRGDFEALVDPVFRFLNETPDRSPMTDWYQTKSGRKVGFTARPVVGGVFLQTLYDPALWKKWAGRDLTKAKDWAPMPVPPQMKIAVPAADTQPSDWRYTTDRPANGWEQPGFDDAAWRKGGGGFGAKGTPRAVIGTNWKSNDIWLRQEVELTSEQLAGLCLWLHHDEDVVIHVNGTEVLRAQGFVSDYESIPLPPAALAAFKPGKNLIALHCQQTLGGQYIDLGLVQEVPATTP